MHRTARDAATYNIPAVVMHRECGSKGGTIRKEIGRIKYDLAAIVEESQSVGGDGTRAILPKKLELQDKHHESSVKLVVRPTLPQGGSQGDHKGVTRGSQEGHKGVTRGSVTGAPKTRTTRTPRVTGRLQGGHKGVTRGSQGGHKGVTRRSQGGHKGVTGGSVTGAPRQEPRELRKTGGASHAAAGGVTGRSQGGSQGYHKGVTVAIASRAGPGGVQAACEGTQHEYNEQKGPRPTHF
eukprot:178733-Prorocentrum_minimum.AAC.1